MLPQLGNSLDQTFLKAELEARGLISYWLRIPKQESQLKDAVPGDAKYSDVEPFPRRGRTEVPKRE